VFWVSGQVVDKEAGADCKRVLKAASTSRARSAAVKQRFQQGSIDEVSFLGAPRSHPCIVRGSIRRE